MRKDDKGKRICIECTVIAQRIAERVKKAGGDKEEVKPQAKSLGFQKSASVSVDTKTGQLTGWESIWAHLDSKRV
jgi:hypothetical protein